MDDRHAARLLANVTVATDIPARPWAPSSDRAGVPAEPPCEHMHKPLPGKRREPQKEGQLRLVVCAAAIAASGLGLAEVRDRLFQDNVKDPVTSHYCDLSR
jgi:hypothetical protein